MKAITSTPVLVRFNPFVQTTPILTSGDRSGASKLPSKVIITRK